MKRSGGTFDWQRVGLEMMTHLGCKEVSGLLRILAILVSCHTAHSALNMFFKTLRGIRRFSYLSFPSVTQVSSTQTHPEKLFGGQSILRTCHKKKKQKNKRSTVFSFLSTLAVLFPISPLRFLSFLSAKEPVVHLFLRWTLSVQRRRVEIRQNI